ncbi:hypothetical protein BJX64DRAFT_295846 [Aspergillus heterothallicus]
MTSTKKRAAESPDPLQDESRGINDEIRVSKKRMTGKCSFNADFWAASHEVERLLLARAEINRKVSLRDFEGTQTEWEQTDEAKAIFQSIKAGEKMVKLCGTRKEDLDQEKWSTWRRIRASWMQLFTSSKNGLGVKTGQGKRDPKMQSAFRDELIRVGNAQHPVHDCLWCPVLGDWVQAEFVGAAHLFPYMHGQTNMDAIFGKTRPAELFSARNGLLMCNTIESNFDSGKLVIVPDLPERPAPMELLAWIKREKREYRVKIIDKSWRKLDNLVYYPSTITWGELDGRKLVFRSNFRPAAKYLYFHYCCQILRRAWGQNTNGGAYAILKDEVGRPFWGTPGRWLPRNMLLGLVEELGHEYKELLNGAGFSKGDKELLVEVVANQIKTRPALKDTDWYEIEDEDEDSDDEDDDDEYDGDGEETDTGTIRVHC